MWMNIKNWLSSIPNDLVGSLEVAARTLSFSFNKLFHELILSLYNFFDLLCKGRLLNNDLFNEISKRVGLILGIVMFFMIIFSMIQMLIDPEKITDKEKGASSLTKRVVIVIVMLALSSFVFDTLYKVQNVVIESRVISNLLLPYKIVDEDVDNFGRVLSENLMFSFYHIGEFDRSQLSTDDLQKLTMCESVILGFENQILKNGDYSLGNMCLNESISISLPSTYNGVNTQEVFVINYNYLLAVLASGFVVYILFMYCFGVGIRMIQLMVLEIISPMMIISYIVPKKDLFDKWWKAYIATYLDIFIRIAIINFVILIIITMFEGGIDNFNFFDSITGGASIDFKTKSFLALVMLLALLTFAKKAPELLKDLLPPSASKIGFGLALKDVVGLKQTAGMIGGALGGSAVGLLAGRPFGAVGGLVSGAFSGFGSKNFANAFTTGWKNQVKANKTIADVRANGGSLLGYQIAKIQRGVGIRTAADDDETFINNLQAEVDMYNTASKEAESEAIKNGANYQIYSAADGRYLNLTELEKLSVDQKKDAEERAKYDAMYKKLLKSASMFNLDYGLAVEKGRVQFNEDGDFVELETASHTKYSSTAAVDAFYNSVNEATRASEIGGNNATIDANMTKLVGNNKSGRGSAGKAIRNDRSTQITNKKLSDQYKSNKANSSK